MEGAGDGTVVAVAVAHGRAASLDRLLCALRDQTRPPDAVVIVDSDATPEVKAVLDRWRDQDERVSVHALGHNGGSAGGFAAGLRIALERRGTAWIAAFDDDAIPASDCLERLLAATVSAPELGAVGAVSMDPDGRFAWPMFVLGRRDPLRTDEELIAFAGDRLVVPVAELAWHALVLPVTTVESLGPPREDLFMWYEDVEYGLRLRRAGLTAYVVPGASVEHPPPARVVRKRFLGVDLDVPVVSPSKAYLMTRNALVVRRDYFGARFWVVDAPLTLLRGVIAAVALPGSTPRLLRHAVVGAMVDAARGRLGPPPHRVAALDAGRGTGEDSP